LKTNTIVRGYIAHKHLSIYILLHGFSQKCAITSIHMGFIKNLWKFVHYKNNWKPNGEIKSDSNYHKLTIRMALWWYKHRYYPLSNEMIP